MARKERFSGGFHNSSESEGSGSLGRIDMETGAPEGSSGPKRKWINLNSSSRDGFSVPMQVIPLSNMTTSERKSLEFRLRSELDQLRDLQRKAESWRGNGVLVSSSSNGYSKGVQKGVSVGDVRRSGSLNSNGSGKVGQGGRELNRSNIGRFQSHKKPTLSVSDAALMKQCESLLKRLMSHTYGWVFNEAVDVVKLKIPDYLTVIKHPMDLGTIKKKLSRKEYSNALEFLADVRLTFSNAMTYNPPGNDVHVMADTLSKFFEARCKGIEKKVATSDLHEEIDIVDPLVSVKRRKQSPIHEIVMRKQSPIHEVVRRKQSPLHEVVRRKQSPIHEVMRRKQSPIHEVVRRKQSPIHEVVRKKPSPVQHREVKAVPVKRKMSDEEKVNLSRDLEASVGDLTEDLVEFLKELSSGESGEDEIEIDIDILSDETLFKLRKLLDEHLKQKSVNNTKAETCEMELPNESGLSNSSTQPGKGNEQVEEDVDIGGDEPPASCYPPVEIEKDTKQTNDNCSNAESFDDSDSSSSSGSEAESPKESTLAQPLKENDGASEGDSNRKDNAQNIVDGERGSPPTERAVPENPYRAALLKNRFADTIIRAQEKSLGQGEKADPEKLRRQREELEILKRKEKARLQAEAKAAEEAKIKAEAEAAAESKRKRELEREAARQALLKMEKTVEINENSRFLQDLEMLSAVPMEHLPGSVDETSPDHSDDGGLGSFKFGSSNPLEQLGLYMKADDEDEEAEPTHTLDVEEGQID